MRYRNYYQHAVYILKCSDGSFYTGHTNNLDRRFEEHAAGVDPDAYTFRRRPVELVYAERFQYVRDAIAWEKRLKKWSRAKKQALIDENWDRLIELARCKNGTYLSKAVPVSSRLSSKRQ